MTIGKVKINKFLLGAALAVVVLFLGSLVWSKLSDNKPTTGEQKTTENNIEKEPNYPKVDKFEVPILMYHYIRNAEGESDLGKNLSVSPANFDNQLKWLKENNYETIKMADLADPDKKMISQIIGQSKKPIILTFDDGYADAYTAAYPVLKKYGFIGTFYIIRNYVGRPEYMNQPQISDLISKGMEIGSHSLSHPDLAAANLTDMRKQIFESKADATTFCYPSGKYNDTTVNLVKEAGYTTAVTTKSGVANQDSSLYELPRIRMQDFSGETLGKKLNE